MFLYKNSNGFYYIYFTDETGKRKKISCRTRTKPDALKFVANFKAMLSEKQQREKSQQNQFQYISELKAEILKYVSVNMQLSTCKIYNRVFNDMERIFGSIPVKLITSRDVEHYKSIRAGEVRAATVNIDILTMKAIFNIAIRMGWADVNPVRGISKLSIPQAENLSFTDEQIKLILGNARGQLKNIILTGLLTGCRLNEIINLQWKNVNFKDGILKIRNKENFKTKTGKIRDIPISDELNRILILIHNGGPPDNVIYFFNPDDYIFKNSKGCIYNKNFISAKFKALLRQLNINEKYHFHCLRHTYITNLIKAGVNINYVKEIAGHSVIETTMNYIHLSTNDLKNAVKSVKIIR